jgi:hypothetical protein
MHTTIAIPDDVPIVALAKAMATINLHAVHGYHRVVTFDHGPGTIPPAVCDVTGCDRLATARDGLRTICAKHWIAARNGV